MAVAYAEPPTSNLDREREALEADWLTWALELFEAWFCDPRGKLIPPAPHHHEFWDWLWAIRRGERARSFVGVWARGGGKSTSAEMACAAVAARHTRNYGLYVCESQDQADDHVSNVATLLESRLLAKFYPDAGSRLLSKFGQVRGWRRNRIRTNSGFTLDALGMDTAARGVKLENQRPDFMVIDDVDGEMDSKTASDRKVKTLTRKILPAGSSDLVVMVIQNLLLKDGIVARLVDGRADWLANRIVSGPHPALRDFIYDRTPNRTRILAGTPTWAGQSRKTCQQMVDDYGIDAFKAECQHDVEDPPGGMFDEIEFQHIARDDPAFPKLLDVTVWVDPAVTNANSSDSHGIQADGLGEDGKIYRLYSWEGRSSPEKVLTRGILKALELGARTVGVETDQGGDTWGSVCRVVWQDLIAQKVLPGHLKPPRFLQAKAGQGQMPKTHRAAQMLVDYERGGIVHVLGTHDVLERALRRFPKTKPLDLTDSSYWSWKYLRSGGLHEKVIQVNWL